MATASASPVAPGVRPASAVAYGFALGLARAFAAVSLQFRRGFAQASLWVWLRFPTRYGFRRPGRQLKHGTYIHKPCMKRNTDRSIRRKLKYGFGFGYGYVRRVAGYVVLQ